MTAQLMDLGVSAAPRLGPGIVGSLEAAMAWAGPRTPVLSRIVADNMRTAGLYSPEVHREYFARSAAHLSGMLHMFRLAGRKEPALAEELPSYGGRPSAEGRPSDGGRASCPPSGYQPRTTPISTMPEEQTGCPSPMAPGLARFVEDRVRLDDSIARLHEAATMGKGVVLMGVHASHFMLVLARMNQELPITVYQRYSRDPRKEEARRRYCEMCGLDFIAEPPSVTNPARRAELMANALRDGRILVITPDMVQSRENGVAVRFFDREVYLPGGSAALSLLVGAPLVTVLARPAENRAITLSFHGPMTAEVANRRRGWRQEATRERMQWYADLLVNEFLRPYPALWFLWGDKRWTRVFRGDPRYTRMLEEVRSEK